MYHRHTSVASMPRGDQEFFSCLGGGEGGEGGRQRGRLNANLRTSSFTVASHESLCCEPLLIQSDRSYCSKLTGSCKEGHLNGGNLQNMVKLNNGFSILK